MRHSIMMPCNLVKNPVASACLPWFQSPVPVCLGSNRTHPFPKGMWFPFGHACSCPPAWAACLFSSGTLLSQGGVFPPAMYVPARLPGLHDLLPAVKQGIHTSVGTCGAVLHSDITTLDFLGEMVLSSLLTKHDHTVLCTCIVVAPLLGIHVSWEFGILVCVFLLSPPASFLSRLPSQSPGVLGSSTGSPLQYSLTASGAPLPISCSGSHESWNDE